MCEGCSESDQRVESKEATPESPAARVFIQGTAKLESYFSCRGRFLGPVAVGVAAERTVLDHGWKGRYTLGDISPHTHTHTCT